jgi:hypothetical protein
MISGSVWLRSYVQDLPGANLKADFTVFDSDDSARIMRKVRLWEGGKRRGFEVGVYLENNSA